MPGAQWRAQLANHRDANGLMEVKRMDKAQLERVHLTQREYEWVSQVEKAVGYLKCPHLGQSAGRQRPKPRLLHLQVGIRHRLLKTRSTHQIDRIAILAETISNGGRGCCS